MSVFANLRWRDGAVAARRMTMPGVLPAVSAPPVPVFPETMRPKDRAIELLRAAAEVEHQFIVQYLYAFYCGGQTETDVFRIAKEEMGHMLTVQNLLAMLDAPPYFGRIGGGGSVDEPFPFNLDPFTISFIARFLVAESPDPAELPGSLKEHLPADLPLETIARVGAIYTALYWLFQDPARAAGPWTVPLGADVTGLEELGHLSDGDLADPAAVSARLSVAAAWDPSVDHIASAGLNILVLPKDDWGVDKAKLRMAALRALHLVAGQGEGPVTLPEGTPAQSHAQRLAKIYDRLDQGPASGPSRFPTNPYTKAHTADPNSETNLITDKTAIDAANALDVGYERLLLNIALSVTSPEDRELAALVAIGLMRDEIHPQAKAVASLRRKQDGNVDLLAGPPFTFPADGIPTDVEEIRRRLEKLS